MAKQLSSADRKALKNAAQEYRKRAAANAAPYSRRIPASLRVVDTGSSVFVIADGTIAPNAAPFEGPEEHPLFGNRNYWYMQPHRPFMSDAARQGSDSAMDKYAQSVYDYAESKGFK